MKRQDSVLLGLHIAYGCARSDIECFTRPVTLASHYATPSNTTPTHLYDLSSPITDAFERESVTLASVWLDAFGLLLHHPSYPHLVNFAPEYAHWAEAGRRACETTTEKAA